MVFINLCPHAINCADASGVVHTFVPSGTVARVAASNQEMPSLGGFRRTQQVFGEVQNLPAPQEGVCFIVSGVVLSALKGSRPDVIAPDTGPTQVRWTPADEAAGLGKAGQTRYVTGWV
jgi:hypothetical protein